MIQVKVMDIREGHKETKQFDNEQELNNYLNRNPLVIVTRKEVIQAQ